MPWWQYALLGGVGGILVEALELFRWVSAWRDARRSGDGRLLKELPGIREYVDVPAHIGMLALRFLLGFASAAIFAAAGQLKGGYVAVALGFCGPALLWRLGEIPQVGSAVASVGSRSRADGTALPSQEQALGAELTEATRE